MSVENKPKYYVIMWKFLQPAAHKPELPAEKVDKEYSRLRRQVFWGIFIGYAGYYLVRKNFSIAMPALESMGYELSDEELESVFTRFKDLADKKKNITSSDIEALVLHRQAAVQGSCQLVSHVVNTGHGVPNISCIKLQRGDEQIEDVAIGTGPLDASFKAINRMLKMDVKLESFSLNAVTDGEDAIGEAVVKVSGPDGRSYTGSGLSTDIIESSIRAYVNGINKIMESGN